MYADTRKNIVAPNPALILESLRSIGYSLENAIADIIDNSISAGAENIWFNTTQNGEYIMISDDGEGMTEAELMDSLRFGNIPDAPVMGVHTYLYEDTSYVVLLSQSVDEWEIMYYSTFKDVKPRELLNDKYLKNAGVINLKEYFEKDDWRDTWLCLQLSVGQYISGDYGKKWSIPDVDRGV